LLSVEIFFSTDFDAFCAERMGQDVDPVRGWDAMPAGSQGFPLGGRSVALICSRALRGASPVHLALGEERDECLMPEPQDVGLPEFSLI
jgi:hypothetical protein